jgi:hypothetical protein
MFILRFLQHLLRLIGREWLPRNDFINWQLFRAFEQFDQFIRGLKMLRSFTIVFFYYTMFDTAFMVSEGDLDGSLILGEPVAHQTVSVASLNHAVSRAILRYKAVKGGNHLALPAQYTVISLQYIIFIPF